MPFDCEEEHQNINNIYCPQCGIKIKRLPLFVKEINEAYRDWQNDYWVSSDELFCNFFNYYDITIKFKKPVYLVRVANSADMDCFETFNQFKKHNMMNPEIQPDDLNLFCYRNMTQNVVFMDFYGFMIDTMGEADTFGEALWNEGMMRLKIIAELPKELRDEGELIGFIEYANGLDEKKYSMVMKYIAEYYGLNAKK